MFSWITSNDEYLQMYHEYYQEFLDKFYASGYITDLVNNTYEMIAEYVDRDPTKFCTTEEFETAVDTIRTFLELRCESIQGQLEGTIGSTDSEQQADSDALIDASSLNLSDMGSMGGGGGGHDKGGPGGDSSKSGGDKSGGFGGSGHDKSSNKSSGHHSKSGSDSESSADSENKENSESGADSSSENMPGGFPGFGGNSSNGDFSGFPGGDMPDFGSSGGFGSNVSTTDWIYVGVSAAALLAAILFALRYRARR